MHRLSITRNTKHKKNKIQIMGEINIMENINFKEASFNIELSFCGLSMDNTLGLLKFANIDSWQVSNDTSIRAFGKDTCCVISPIMGYDELNELQLVLDILEKNGAFINKTCYTHINVYEKNFSYEDCIKLCNLTIPKETLILKALNVNEKRTSVLDRTFIDKINTYKLIESIEDFKKAWYEYIGKEDTSKACIDFHAFFNGKGLAINYFNASLNYWDVLAYIDFAIGLVQKAHNEKCKPWTRHNDSNETRQFCDFLWGMGIRGKNPRFKTTRAILTQYLDGNAWKK